MRNIVKTVTAGAVLGGSLLCTGGLAIASAQPLQLQDGLVNVAVGNVSVLKNANVGVGATVAAGVCGINVSDVNVLADQVDTDGGQRTVCTVPGGAVTISQNAVDTPATGASSTAPGVLITPVTPVAFG